MTLLTMSRERLARETQRATERLAEAEADASRARWRAAGYWAAWLACYLSGTAVAFASMAARTQDLADILFWGGLVLGNVGGFFVWVVWLVTGTNSGEL
jgi:hypothetical protein